MAEGKEAHLNGAYYGPPIPPPERRSYHRPGRGSGCCCGPCCLLSLLLKLLISLVIIVGVVALVAWLVVRPNRVKVHVDSVSLSQFNFTDGSTLHYNLSLVASVRNPNKRIGIYYDRLEARAFYKGQRFDSQFLPTFYQGHKNTTTVNPVFRGQRVLLLGASQMSEYEQEKREGRFEVEVKFYARIRFKFKGIKTHHYNPDADCELMVPLTTDGSPGGFTRTKCDIDF